MVKQNSENSKKKENKELKATREGFGEGLLEAAGKDKRIYAVTADLAGNVGMKEFSEKFPERFVEVGVAEQNLVTAAAGIARAGKIPFAASFAVFNPGRNWEQIRTTICYNNQPVIVVGSHAGLGVGEDGATHQALEDVALMRVLPNMQVIIPCDAAQAKKAVLEIVKNPKPTYIRIFRQKTPLLTNAETEFKIGKAQIFMEGKEKNNVLIISCGPIINKAIEAAEKLKKAGISCTVINSHTVKPLDEQTILKHTEKSKLIVIVEDHQIAGGLGGAVSELLSAKLPRKILFIGVKDSFGESGKDEELYKKHKLDSESIAKTIMQNLNTSVKKKKSEKNKRK
ncbi:MAG: transketolase family protein [Candidatus Nanoarchaeia archaeon]